VGSAGGGEAREDDGCEACERLGTQVFEYFEPKRAAPLRGSVCDGYRRPRRHDMNTGTPMNASMTNTTRNTGNETSARQATFALSSDSTSRIVQRAVRREVSTPDRVGSRVAEKVAGPGAKAGGDVVRVVELAAL